MPEVRPARFVGPITPLPGSFGSRGYLIRRSGDSHNLGEQLGRLYEHWYRTLDLNPAVRLVLRDIHNRTGAPAYFGRLRDGTISIVDVVDSLEVPRVAYSPARLQGAGYRSAVGKALLSSLSESELLLFLREHQPEECLIPALEAVRHTGIAYDVGEFVRHVASIAVPTPYPVDGVAGALAVSLPVTEYEERHAEAERALHAGTQTLRKLTGRQAANQDTKNR